MKVTIQKKEENKLLNRLELSGEIVFDAVTPSNADVLATLAKDLGNKEELIIVKNIYTKFSDKKASFSAVSYKTAEAKAKYEMSTKHLRKIEAESAKKRAEEVAAFKEAEEKKKAEAEAAKAAAVEVKTEAPASE